MFGCFGVSCIADILTNGKVLPSCKEKTFNRIFDSLATIDALGAITLLVLGILAATHVLPFSSTALFAAGGGIVGFDLLVLGAWTAIISYKKSHKHELDYL